MNADREVRDPALDALMREHSAETPPAHVDAAILAAAHRAVGGAPRDAARALASRPWRWWMPLAAAAAVGVIVIGVLPLAPTTLDETPSVASDAPVDSARDRAGAISTERAKQEAAAPVQKEARVAGSAEPKTPARESSSADPFPAGAARKNADETAGTATRRERGIAAPASRTEIDVAGRAERAQEVAPAHPPAGLNHAPPPAARAGAALSAPPPSRPALESRSAASIQRSLTDRQAAERSATGSTRADKAIGTTHADDAAAWIARIRTLRDESKLADAARELARFREAFADADARLPADLREWSASIPR